ncbi:sirohydrochlorin chelatase [Nocardia sp. XZ_19_369]|uniref:sirohydrochlorin chelatase n=1 Tax=Nocardia sp. XZ_19_369 TaxID=2769487 RepID=UPI00188E7445|nr:CbiX/SirB N-terminal domain-containing protein [Nocardia sp. XZ_19_369]
MGGALAARAIGSEVSGRPALIAVAHGSRDPRSAATMSAVVAELAAARPGFDVRLAFLDLSAPSVEQVVDAVAAEGHTHAVVTPLLLGSAFHARVDLPGLLAAAHARHPQLQLTQAGVLGPDARLIAALRDRVAEASIYSAGRDRVLEATASVPQRDGKPQATAFTLLDREPEASASSTQRDHSPEAPTASSQRDGVAQASTLSAPRNPLGARSNRRLGIAVAAVGSSSPAANARTAEVARRLAALTGHLTEICFATTEPTLPQAISRLRTRGAEDILVAPWFLAPGLLTDRLIAAAPDVLHANVIGPHAALTDIVWDRYDAAIATTLTMSA